ncbi:MAG TPA: substrate-binding domain-containing protein, partial [Terracidiphilus sp.]|nr:substrate-binding domain-containing protein [Terracidiphilus sp.]
IRLKSTEDQRPSRACDLECRARRVKHNITLPPTLGCNGYLHQSHPDLEEQEISQLLARRLDALIIASCRPTVEVFFRIEKQKTPYVLIDRNFPGLSSNFVGGDDLAAGILATQHLVDIGCKKIAHIRGPKTSPGIQRLEGYKRALVQNGRSVIDEYVIFEPKGDVGGIQRGAEAMQQLLNCKRIPDGVFCFNDPLAMGAVNVVVNQGLRIPYARRSKNRPQSAAEAV